MTQRGGDRGKGDVEGTERGGHERVKQRTMKRGKSKKEVILGTERGKEEEESETNGMKKGERKKGKWEDEIKREGKNGRGNWKGDMEKGNRNGIRRTRS
jgi:hypothetical protein